MAMMRRALDTICESQSANGREVEELLDSSSSIDGKSIRLRQ
jgi:hypothetical protein